MPDLTPEEARDRERKFPQTILLRPHVTFTDEQKAKIKQVVDGELSVEEARANVYIDATMSTPEDVDALIAAVRRDTLAQVRGVVKLESTYRDGMNDVTWIARDPLLAALDALEG